MHALITFDDGYLDNYTVAFPLLKQHGLRAAFFVVSSFVGTSFVPWWDEIAYLLRHTRQTTFDPGLGRDRIVPIQPDREMAIARIVELYKSDENRDPAGFLRLLRKHTEVNLPIDARHFLNWDEARTMAAAGMEIGAHSHTHPLMGKLSVEAQKEELGRSKQILEEQIGRPITSLAYPVGSKNDFTDETKRIAKEAGYDLAFSFYGGVNPWNGGSRFDIRRGAPNPMPAGFRAETILLTRFGKLEPMVRRVYRNLRSKRVYA
jgi:peptidoglycan/xylan/chitin deacetylase (PgdA/CDA1 family)